MNEDGDPIAYSGLTKGVPVRSRSGNQFGTVERVLQIEDEDIFRGIVVATRSGLRFVDRDQVERITTSQVSCTLTDEQVGGLPRPPAMAPDANVPERSTRGVVIARCRQGALFETMWIPLVSLKAIRLGPFRVQRCPVHGGLDLIQRVDPETLSTEQRRAAARYPASPIP